VIFSDRGRWWKIGLISLLYAVLGGWYARWALAAEQGWRWAMTDPVGRNGAPMVFPLWEVTAVEGPDRYRISKVVKDVPLHGDARDLKVGDTVSVIGHFDASGPVVEVEVRELHVLRKYKEALGILGFVWVVLAAPFAFRIRGGRLTERGGDERRSDG
jgi:hypothetical protein